jgi:protein O-mannosyl-transferase
MNLQKKSCFARKKVRIHSPESMRSRNSYAERRASLRGLILIILAAAFCDYDSWGHSFVADDAVYIVDNHFIQNPSNVFRIFVSPLVPTPLGIGHLYRPVTALSLGLNCWIHGLNPDGFHLVNRILHILICVGVFWVLHYLRLSASAAFVAAILFAVHPIQTEAVTYIDGRSDLLAMLFIIFAWLSHVHARQSDEAKGKYFVLALGLYFFAMMSKESGITWIAVVLITEYVFFSKCSLVSFRKNIQKGLWKPFAGYLCAILVFLGVRALALSKVLQTPTPFTDNPLAHVPLLVRELTALKVMFQSLSLLFWPAHLSRDYSYNQIPLITEWGSLMGLVVIGLSLILVLLLIWSYRRASHVFFGLSYFLATYSVISNLMIPIGTIRADRLLYAPSLGIFLLVGVLLSDLDRRFQSNRAQKSFRVVVAIVFILLAMRTIQRNGDWRDTETLSAQTVHASPNSSRAHYFLGSAYFTRREYVLALEQYRVAESIYAKDPQLLYELGRALHQLGRTDEAIQYFRQAIDLAPQYPMIRFHLAIALRARGDLEGAKLQNQAIISFYDDLIRKDPSSADHHYFKANALSSQGQPEQALREYRKALQIDPTYDAAKVSIDHITRQLTTAGTE